MIEVIIKGEAKEIAALVVSVQEHQFAECDLVDIATHSFIQAIVPSAIDGNASIIEG